MPKFNTIDSIHKQTRRRFLANSVSGLGALYLGSSLIASPVFASSALDFTRDPAAPLSPLPPQFAAKAKQVIFLHMGGGPSQLEMFDHKPELTKFDGQDCPASFLEGKRFAFISGVPKLLGSRYPFHQTGQSGAWISDRLPFLEKHIDDLCIIKSMRTDQFNHAPAQLLLKTGDPQIGHASLGAWTTYGLGSENQSLPGFIVLQSSGGNTSNAGKPLWGAGFLPSAYQGVQVRAHGEPVLYLDNPAGVSRAERRHMLDVIAQINRQAFVDRGNPETITRIAQYEMAYRMQLEAKASMDIRREPDSVLTKYGAKPGKASYANNCLTARRLIEHGVRFIQLHHWGWDSHGTNANESLDIGFAKRCREVDQATAALLSDLKERGLMEDTLVVWGGEFGRTPMRENRGGQDMKFAGRDHHPNAFTMWMAGAGVKPGSYGETDELGYEVVKNPVEIRDLHATILYLLGFNHHNLNYPSQGLDRKITGVRPARVVGEVLA